MTKTREEILEIIAGGQSVLLVCRNHASLLVRPEQVPSNEEIQNCYTHIPAFDDDDLNANAIGIQGIYIEGLPTNGQTLVYDAVDNLFKFQSSLSGEVLWTNVNKTGSSLADLAIRSAGALNSGTLQDSVFPAFGGDITNVAGNTSLTVAKLQGRAVANTAPNDGQVLKWNVINNRWEPADDQTGSSGGGITSLNGANLSSQSFAKVDDTNVTLSWNSSNITGVHTLTAGWNGTLAKSRQHSSTVYSDQANTYSAGSKQSFNSNGTNAGFNIGFSSGDPSNASSGDIWGNSTVGKLKIRENGVSALLLPVIRQRKTVAVNNSAVDLFEVVLPPTTGTSGKLTYQVFASNGTDTQIVAGMMMYVAANNGGVYNIQTPFVMAETESVKNGQSMSVVWNVTSGSNKIVVNAVPNTSFSSTTLYYIEYSLENFGDQQVNYL